MRTWVVSDWHLGHERIVPLCNRPFSSVQEMNETIIGNHNLVVAPEDTVYVLGDVALGKIDESLSLIGEFNGHLILVEGNHDRCFRGGKKSAGLKPQEWDARYIEAGFEKVLRADLLRLNDEEILMSHFPYDGDSHEADRYSEFRLPDMGLTLLHGHTHGKNVVSESKAGTLQIHVGVDAHGYSPVPLSTIEYIILKHRGILVG